ncbi:MAG TPA: FAD-dependent oxidoreductase [Pseudomonadales bacterium]|jgi:glycerol-3-phosphate dehydrogenase
MPVTCQPDIAIVGGGIAGLWLLNRARAQGYSAVLLTNNDLGHAQTIASQGMIHGGLKYALAGTLSGESEAIAAMPDRWNACLAGNGEIDLSAVNVLSRDFYLWSSGQLASRLSSFFASKALRGRIESIARADHPAALANPAFRGSVYRLVDVVLDVPDLLRQLAAPHRDCIYRIDDQALHWDAHDGRVRALCLGEGIRMEAQHLVLAAGAGNADLLEKLGVDTPAMQTRPLHQVLVSHPDLPTLYGHCTGGSTKASPRLTVSTHTRTDGQRVWYLGGDLATDGVRRTPAEQLAFARQELGSIFPWMPWRDARFASLWVDRAEPLQPQRIKPDEAFAAPAGGFANVTVAWPTKLTLAPDLADRVLAQCPAPARREAPAALPLPQPGIAAPCWEQLL